MNNNTITQKMNELGQEGWEFVQLNTIGVSEGGLFFKRRLP